ncbi:LysR family transcriptional regulator [Desulfogranum mediterraneum]|uniref:LysR family transcriptional regulator n=1 Tax=Desulfogranum mediterraneum TaxID=160661 RepID=UPI00040C43BF|nr:LysR family transcriptional regulator [Desulfogranum mediterraneum]
MLPDFNRLKVFYHIFNQQSSTAAARQLHLTQSGVSQHLKKLEEELQTALFTRVNRRLVPTAAAQKLYTIVQGFMGELEAGLRHLDESRETPAGLLRIGAPAEFGQRYLPQVCASFHRRYPAVSFQLELGDPNHLFGQVAAGELDFAYIDILPIFLDTPGGDRAYTIESMVVEEFVLACSREVYEEQVLGADYEELIRQNYIGYKTDIALFRSWFKLHFGEAPPALSLVFVADSATAIVAAIEEGLGLGITVSHLISRQIARGTIVPIRITPQKLENSISCVRFRDKEETVTERCFQEHLCRELRQISEFSLQTP